MKLDKLLTTLCLLINETFQNTVCSLMFIVSYSLLSTEKNKISFCSFQKSYKPFPHSTNNGTELRSGWSRIQMMYENVLPNFTLVLLFECAEVESGKDLFK